MAAGGPLQWSLAVSFGQESGFVDEVARRVPGFAQTELRRGLLFCVGGEIWVPCLNLLMMFVSLYSHVEVR